MFKSIKLLVFLACIGLMSDSAAQHPSNPKVDNAVYKELESHKSVDCLISFNKKVDVSSAYTLKGKEQKAYFVFNQLNQAYHKDQNEVRQYLETKNTPFTAFYIVNAMAASLNHEELMQIAAMKNVKNISLDPSIKMEDVEQVHSTKNLADPEWGIQMINADSVWMMGYEGQGVVIGGQDTGYEWEHPVLKNKYRGLIDSTADHNYNWHDAIFEINPGHNDSIASPEANPCGLSVPFPCDDHNHGTHTMGTMVGSDSTNMIGVAPRSKWMACRNMERGIGKPSTYLECFEWFLAPTDLDNMNPRPEMAPDVINNSWSCPEDEGCNESNWDLMREAIAQLKASGVMVVVSAGNDGRTGCASIAKAPAMFEESFSVGATRQSDLIAAFSSLGPVAVDSSFRLKPDVSAPGHNVRSSIRQGAYANFSGTSMAGPHVAGAVALIINANPELRGDVPALESILKTSAIPKTDSTECHIYDGLEVPNHVYGHGRIDVFKAVQLALTVSSNPNLTAPQLEWSIYPNPTSSILNVEMTDILSHAHGLLFDQQGRVVQSFDHVPQQIDLTAFESGIYYLKIISDQGSGIQKLVIQH